MANNKTAAPSRGGYRPKKKHKGHKQGWLAKNGGVATMVAHGNAGYYSGAGTAVGKMIDNPDPTVITAGCADICIGVKTNIKKIAPPYIAVAVLKGAKKAFPPLRKMFPSSIF
jgi:hypothetical protein